MKVAIVGSRGLPLKLLEKVTQFVKDLEPSSVVVTGGAIGVDTAAMEGAKKAGLSMIVHYPNWFRDKRAAGFIRNQKIIQDADAVVVFWDGSSLGTKHSIKLAQESNKPLQVFVGIEGTFNQIEPEGL